MTARIMIGPEREFGAWVELLYRHEIDEAKQVLKLWIRRMRGNRKLVCSGRQRKFVEAMR